jgi:23S rRNA (cytosine1962-C5)-methyltransferase
VRLTSFKHTGIFPEQAANWTWIHKSVQRLNKPKVLNLFGYTGIASVVAAQAGADVTHVDASKQSLSWARENAELSGITMGIRYILDDALKFVKREIRRGAKYDGIILDPPAFGRGPKGETWKIEEQLPELMEAVQELLGQGSGAFFLLNGYAAGYTASSFRQLTESYFDPSTLHDGEYGELQIAEAGTGRIVPEGIYVRFTQ